MKFTVQVEGVDLVSVIAALQEAARLIEDGNTSGFDRNEDGNFYFVEGDQHLFSTGESCTMHTAVCEMVERLHQGNHYDNDEERQSDIDVMNKLQKVTGR
ncbi:hypothetical protein pEaSNUABM44_00016 [Erwinia phage pEa_SNUABM_44]|nr:hypothetical protein pEaSNUABM44_00016 [Erwinia phage pEa_SNUABM_44]